MRGCQKRRRPSIILGGFECWRSSTGLTVRLSNVNRLHANAVCCDGMFTALRRALVFSQSRLVRYWSPILTTINSPNKNKNTQRLTLSAVTCLLAIRSGHLLTINVFVTSKKEKVVLQHFPSDCFVMVCVAGYAERTPSYGAPFIGWFDNVVINFEWRYPLPNNINVSNDFYRNSKLKYEFIWLTIE